MTSWTSLGGASDNKETVRIDEMHRPNAIIKQTRLDGAIVAGTRLAKHTHTADRRWMATLDRFQFFSL